MAYLFVGTTSYTYSDFSSPVPYTHSIPVPTGTQVGDLLLVGFWGGSGHSVPDSRLTTVNRASPTTPAGAYGIATDLTDVQIETDYIFNNTAIIVAALRDTGTTNTTLAYYDGTVFDPVLVASPGSNVGVCFVVNFGGALPDDDADWTTQATATQDSYFVKCYSATAPVGGTQQLNAGTFASGRSAFWMLFTATLGPDAGGNSYLRQRQSPVRTPSRVRPVDLRARQTTRI